MEQMIHFACENAHSAPWVFFLLIMLAGLNVPISIDVILITAGALAATCLPEKTLLLYFFLSFACWIAAWEAYAIGRFVGPRLYHLKWFSHVLTLKRIEQLHLYYEKFGILTFLIGRFIPGGVRNALFMTSGLGKMPFHKFILRDLFPCYLSCGILYYLGHLFGSNYSVIVDYFKTYNLMVIAIIILLIACFLTWKRLKKQKDLTQ